jgi:LPXTG-motif cell wall-anchored protein
MWKLLYQMERKLRIFKSHSQAVRFTTIPYSRKPYQDEQDLNQSKWEGKRTADEWLDWTPIDSMAGSVIVDNGQATIREENILNRGGIASPLMAVDFSKNPTLTLDVVGAKKEWSLLLYFEGAREGYVIQQPNSSLAKQSFQIRSLMEQAYPNVNVQGVQKLKVWIVAEGEDKATVTVRDLELAYATFSDSRKMASRITVVAAGCLALLAGALLFYRRKRKSL